MIYIQKAKYLNALHHFDCALAMHGAIESRQNYKLMIYEAVKYTKVIFNKFFIKNAGQNLL